MHVLLKLAGAIDALNERIGRAVAWLALAMVLIGAWNALARYLGRFAGTDLSSNGFIEAQWYMFSLLFLLGAGYTLKEDAHVRVDVLYGRLPLHRRAWIDVAGVLLFLLPFCIFGVSVSWEWVLNSWTEREVSPDPGGLPRYPLKAMVPVAFVLLGLQGISMLIRRLQVALAPRVPLGKPASTPPESSDG